MIRDRQAVALGRLQQILARNAEPVEFDPLVIQALQCEKPVRDEPKLVVLVVGQVDNQHRRPIVDPAHQPDRAARHDVGNE